MESSLLPFIRACAWLFIALFVLSFIHALYLQFKIEELTERLPQLRATRQLGEARREATVSWKLTALALVSILFLVVGPR